MSTLVWFFCSAVFGFSLGCGIVFIINEIRGNRNKHPLSNIWGFSIAGFSALLFFICTCYYLDSYYYLESKFKKLDSKYKTEMEVTNEIRKRQEKIEQSDLTLSAIEWNTYEEILKEHDEKIKEILKESEDVLLKIKRKEIRNMQKTAKGAIK